MCVRPERSRAAIAVAAKRTPLTARTDAQAWAIDGPFTEAKELIAGYTLIQVKSKEEALEWTRRFPNPVGEGAEAEIEVRQLFELDDFGSNDAVDRFRDIEARKK